MHTKRNTSLIFRRLGKIDKLSEYCNLQEMCIREIKFNGKLVLCTSNRFKERYKIKITSS